MKTLMMSLFLGAALWLGGCAGQVVTAANLPAVVQDSEEVEFVLHRDCKPVLPYGSMDGHIVAVGDAEGHLIGLWRCPKL